MRTNHAKIWLVDDSGKVTSFYAGVAEMQRLHRSIAVGNKYYATYHGQFVVRDAEDEGRPVMHFDTKDAMIAYILLIGGNR